MWSQAYRVVCVLALVVICGGLALPLAAAKRAPGPSRPRTGATEAAPSPTTGGGTPTPVGTAPAATPGTTDPATPPGATPSRTPQAAPPTTAELRHMRANELGVVPVVMYHRIMTKRSQSLDRTPKELHADLVRMIKEHYVPITAAQFVTGRIDVPAGTHPIVLTFDDSSPSQLAFDAHGNPRRDTAVGVMLDVARHYPQFRPVATMYVIASAPFQEGGAGLAAHGRRALRWLVAHGFDLGNHTMHHTYFASASRKKARAEIATAQQRIKQLGGASPVTLAYPGGFPPKPIGLAASGSYGGASYKIDGAFLAGANPSPSPFAADFPRYEIPRIRGQNHASDCDGMCLGSWLDRLNKKGSDRYTSDGDAHSIAYPRRTKVTIAKRFRSVARPY
ncbi:MAG TPA: polysaccharide deacetylase family protein [Streptosporangiaceae bacterium]